MRPGEEGLNTEPAYGRQCLDCIHMRPDPFLSSDLQCQVYTLDFTDQREQYGHVHNDYAQACPDYTPAPQGWQFLLWVRDEGAGLWVESAQWVPYPDPTTPGQVAVREKVREDALPGL